MAWENKPLTHYTDNPWGKTLVVGAERPGPDGEGGVAHLMQVQYDAATGKRIADSQVLWDLRDLRRRKKNLTEQLDDINAKITYVQEYLNTLPEPAEPPVEPAPPA